MALGIGGSYGEGILAYQGKNYPFSISGVSLVDIGISTFLGAGKVYELKNLNDFSGNYAAAQAAFAIRGGAGEVSMRNAKGATIIVLSSEGKESATRLSLGPSGVSIKLK